MLTVKYIVRGMGAGAGVAALMHGLESMPRLWALVLIAAMTVALLTYMSPRERRGRR